MSCFQLIAILGCALALYGIGKEIYETKEKENNDEEKEDTLYEESILQKGLFLSVAFAGCVILFS